MNKKMNKKILLSWLLATSLLLTSCGWNTNIDNKVNQKENTAQTEPLTWAWSLDKPSIKDNTNIKKTTKETTKVKDKKDIPNVYIAFANEQFKKLSEKNKANYNIFVDNNSELAKWVESFFNNNVWKIIKVKNTKDKTTIDREIFKYAPVQLFKVDTPIFKYNEIKKENPEIIHTIKTKDWNFFMFSIPFFWEEYLTVNDNIIKEIKDSTLLVKENKDAKSDIFLFEDLANPQSAVEVLSDEFNKIYNNNNVYIAFFPRNDKLKENSIKLMNFLLLNSEKGKVNVDLMKAMFSKQKDLISLNIKDWSNIIEILKTSQYKDKVKDLKTWKLWSTPNFDSKKVFNILAKKLNILWPNMIVDGIPSVMEIKDKNIQRYKK